jgi:porphobilinogen deaminase
MLTPSSLCVVVLQQLHFQGLVAMPDGSKFFETTRTGAIEDAVKIGQVHATYIHHRHTTQRGLDDCMSGLDSV